MTTRQYNFFVKQISTLHTAKIGDYTFNINNRFNNVFELEQNYKGGSVILFVGDRIDCIEAAKECVQMIFGDIK